MNAIEDEGVVVIEHEGFMPSVKVLFDKKGFR